MKLTRMEKNILTDCIISLLEQTEEAKAECGNEEEEKEYTDNIEVYKDLFVKLQTPCKNRG